MSEKIEPCPVCHQELGEIQVGMVGCQNMLCPIVQVYMSVDEWNSRPTEQALRERVRELEGALEDIRTIADSNGDSDPKNEELFNLSCDIDNINGIAVETLAGKE